MGPDSGEGEGESEGEGEGEGTLSVTVQERAGVARENEYVQFGVPLPRDWNVTDVSVLRLSDASKALVPAQFEVLARWGGTPDDTTAPIKWVLAAYFATMDAGSSEAVTVDMLGPGPVPAAAIGIDDSEAGALTVDTGGAVFALDTSSGFNLIDQVTIGGETLLTPLSAVEAIHYESMDGTNHHRRCSGVYHPAHARHR